LSERRSVIEVRSERLRSILLYIRRILGWSAVMLGDKLGVSRQSINKIESGKSGLSKTEYLLLRRVLDDEIAAVGEEKTMLPIILEVLVDHPERYQAEEREEIFAKMKLVAPAVIAEPEERKTVSSAWKGILLAGGVIVTATLVALLKGSKDD
jgi:DNA-binding XRE family transcriptional regulator